MLIEGRRHQVSGPGIGKKNISLCSLGVLGDVSTLPALLTLGVVSISRGGESVLTWPSVLTSLLQAQPDHLAFPLVSYCAPAFSGFDL